MSSVFQLCLVLVYTITVQAVVHPPRYTTGLVEPAVIDAEPGRDDVWSILEEASHSASQQQQESRTLRSVPTTTPPGFGKTVPLTGDHHTYGLVHWSGLPKERIFILTRKRNSQSYSTESFLWISKDYGTTFNNITNLFPNDAIAEWYYISSNADKLVFTDRINKRVYVTLDEGDSFSSVDLSFVPDRLVFQKSWAVNVAQYEDHILGFDNGKKELWVSTDTGLTWTKLGDNVTRYAWRELDSTLEHPSTVYFDMKVNDSCSLLYNASQEVNNYQPQLFDPSLGGIMPGSFVLSHQYMFVQKNYSLLEVTTEDSPLLISHKRGNFQSAGFPLNLEEKHYALVDASEDQVLMAVYHNPNDTHVYISEEAGLNYTLSLNNIISPPEDEWIDSYPTFDVYVVNSLLGTYIANRRVPFSDRGSTVISYDKGGEWQSVMPPTVDRNGNPVTCTSPCSLHLHMFVDSSYFVQPILSRSSAPGIIMAVGNIGSSITSTQLRLYMSDNGGVTWRELFPGYKLFQLLNYGVFTVVVEKASTAFFTQISCDEGYTWQNYTFTDYTQQVRTVAMFTERGEASQHATIFAYHPQATFSTFQWLVIDLNFTTLELEQCNHDDYYLWKPTDERPDQDCILGESISYERRLPDRCCYIDTSYDRPVNRTSCTCTKEDFECEFNFERVGLDGPCQHVEGYIYPPAPPTPCPELGNYTYTSGYRKIAGDKCVKGAETFYLPLVQICPLEAPGDINLFVTDDSYTVLVGEKVHFQFTQGHGAILSTEYQWSYGDNSTANFIGLVNASQTSHTYLKPGVYKVHLRAFNTGGQGVDSITVSVSDELIGVKIVTPTFVFVEAPTNFFANVTTKYGTTTLYNAHYTWTIDGHTIIKESEYYSYMFTIPGLYTVELTVYNVGGLVMDNTTVSVINPTTSLQISMVLVGSGPVHGFVPVNHPVSFEASLTEQKSFPVSTSFHWLIVSSNGTHVYDGNITSSNITLSLPRWDQYTVSVISNAEGEVAHGVMSFVAEEILSFVTPTLNPLYRVNQLIHAPLNVLTEGNIPFTGTLGVRVWQKDSTDITSGTGEYLLQEGQGGNITVSFILITPGSYSIQFKAANNISNVGTTKLLSVASVFEYEYFRLFFDASGGNDFDWLTKLQNEIINTLLLRHHLETWQLTVNVTEETNPAGNTGLKREEGALVVVAHITLLPTSLQPIDTALAANITEEIIIDSNNGILGFTVEGELVRVTGADKGPSIIIVDPAVVVDEHTTSFLTLAISLAVGGVIVILVVIAIVIGAIVYYKKKYRSLEVRYSRLRQGPMRFTFTAEGENVEEEEWRDEGEGSELDDKEDDKPLT